jgi:cyclophilin family peptidyl-prolyl cis-trans isomerase
MRGPGLLITKPPDDSKVRERIAIAEAKRGAGVDELVGLVDLAVHGDGTRLGSRARELAVRGLGRVGGQRAQHTLLAALADPAIRGDAADAIGVLASLDDLSADSSAAVTSALADALVANGATASDRAASIQALGRAGTLGGQAPFVALFDGKDKATREDIAFALARYGRRKIGWQPELRDRLVHMLDEEDGLYATIYAFAREFEPPKTEQKQLALSLAKRLTSHPESMVRAIAAQAIAHQGLTLGDANAALVQALLDKDWRVSIEATRALASEKSDDASRDQVAAALAQRSRSLASADSEGQAVTEMMRLLLPYAQRPSVQQAFSVAETQGQNATPITRMWIQCLAADARIRAAKGASYDELEKCPLLPHLVAPLLADLVTEKIGPIALRRAQVATLFASDDARTQAAAIGAMSSLWGELKDSERDALIGQLASAIAVKDTLVAGAAIEAVDGFFDAAKTLPAKSPLTKKLAALDAAVIKRATEEQDVELAASAIEMVGKRKLAADACRARLTGEPVITAAARKCLRAFGESPVEPTEPAAATLPAFPLIVGGDKLTWVLTTTRGEIRIELDPHEAPWAVSSIVALTEKHFYDGLEMHRVVPDFVAQGGDPTQSGAGGPGYSLPAEPSASACLVEGGVGMADAGRDSAGSQWFIMHSWAPHLDARYTCVGRVVDGAKVANALLIGDRVLAARIEHSPH